MNIRRFWARLLTALGLGVWLGGIAFAGACAPLLFRIARGLKVEAVAPQMFGAILARFEIVALACAVFALLGWVLDRPAPSLFGPPRARTFWKAQGALTLLMLAVTLLMSFRVLPRMSVLQREFLPQLRVAAGTRPANLDLPKARLGDPVRDEFERLHALSTQLTMGVFWMGLAALAAFAARAALESPLEARVPGKRSNSERAGEESAVAAR